MHLGICSYQRQQHNRYCFHLVSLCVCVSLMQNVLPEALSVRGTTTEAALSHLPGVYVLVDRLSLCVAEITIKLEFGNW